VVTFGLFSQCLGIIMAQLCGFFRREICFLGRVEVFFHLFYNMFRFNIILNLEVGRSFDNLMSMTADRAELPFLEAIHVRERSAPLAADNKVHGNVVMCVILIKIYRRFIKNCIEENSKKNSPDSGSVEILERNTLSLLGALCTSCFRPRHSGIPQYCDNHQKVDEKSRQ
jgi:hypothetical protein